MFDSIRRHQRVLQFILLVLIFPAFAFFGIQGYDSFFSQDDAVAKVGDSGISREEFEAAHQRQLERLRQMFGGELDPALVDTAALRAEVLESLVTQRALLSEAREQRVVITDDELRRTILAMPELRREDGSFDMDRYRALLASQGRSEAMFEAELRRDLALQALPNAIAQTVLVPDALIERLARLGEQQREIRQRSFLPSAFESQVDTSEEALKRFYEQNPAIFESPEQASVEYLVLDPRTIEAGIELNADEVRQYYEQNKARFVTEEQRRASHIMVEVEQDAGAAEKQAAREKAQALLERLRGGADFAELARTESDDSGSASSGGDLGFFTASMMEDAFSQAAFALQPGEISEVIETESGYHVIRLAEIRPGAERPFESVRAELEAEIRKQQSAGRLAEAAENFANLVYEQPDSLQPAAERFGLTVQTAAEVRRSGVDSLPPEHPLNQRRLLQALFSSDSIASRRNTEAIDIGGGMLASARIVEHRPAHLEPFEGVREKARERLIARESAAAARKAGEELLVALRNGKAEAGEGFEGARTIGRAPNQALPTQAVEAVFRADAGKLPAYAGAELEGGGYAVFEITKLIEPSEEVLARRKPLYKGQLEQAYGQVALGAYVEAVKARLEIVRRLEAVAPSNEEL
jgi:peptidyl-prolyl cis-trans isomerase D